MRGHGGRERRNHKDIRTRETNDDRRAEADQTQIFNRPACLTLKLNTHQLVLTGLHDGTLNVLCHARVCVCTRRVRACASPHGDHSVCVSSLTQQLTVTQRLSIEVASLHTCNAMHTHAHESIEGASLHSRNVTVAFAEPVTPSPRVTTLTPTHTHIHTLTKCCRVERVDLNRRGGLDAHCRHLRMSEPPPTATTQMSSMSHPSLYTVEPISSYANVQRKATCGRGVSAP